MISSTGYTTMHHTPLCKRHPIQSHPDDTILRKRQWRHFPMTSWTRHEHTPLSNPRTLIYAPFCIRPSMEAPLYNYLRSLTRSFWLQEIQIYLRFHLALFLNIPNYLFIYFLLLILFLFLVKVNLNFVGFLLLVYETKFYVSFHAAVITLLIK